MGKALADAFPQARDVFAELDAALGEKLSETMFEGPEDKLTLTANAQPALMAVSMVVIRVLEAEGFSLADRAAYVAGHSLGEYSALCAAGSFSLADTARLLRIRGDAMQAAVPPGEGAMAAIIGLERIDVEHICGAAPGGVCQIANDNGGGQLVISGAKEAVESAAETAREKGARRAVLLPVSAPFHSALMAPAAETMRAALATVEIAAPAVPLVANVLAAPIKEPDTIRESLVKQVTGQVRWRETVEWLAGSGVDTLVEAGAGKVLSGLAKRIDRQLTTMAVANPDDVRAFLEKTA